MQAMAKSLSLRLIPLSKAHLPLFMTRSTILTQPSSGAGDTNVHSSDEPPVVDYPDKPAKFSGAEEAQEKGESDLSRHSSAMSPPTTDEPKENIPPFAPSGKLESHEVVTSSEGPLFQQKRRFSSASHRDPHKVEGDREYFEHRKPSSLSHLQFEDTRKPITRASDGGASALDVEGGRGTMVEDTVDAALARAEMLFWESAMKGVPDWPQSKALARMLRLREQQQGHAGG